MMFGSVLPDNIIEWGTDVVFIAAFGAAVVYLVKRALGFFRKVEDEVTDDD